MKPLQKTLSQYRGYIVSEDDVKNLAEDEARKIYLSQYYLGPRFALVRPACAHDSCCAWLLRHRCAARKPVCVECPAADWRGHRGESGHPLAECRGAPIVRARVI